MAQQILDLRQRGALHGGGAGRGVSERVERHAVQLGDPDRALEGGPDRAPLPARLLGEHRSLSPGSALSARSTTEFMITSRGPVLARRRMRASSRWRA